MNPTIVVTRAEAQAAALSTRLEAAGLDVLEVPTIAVVAPPDVGRALRAAVAAITSYDWVVLTSPNGADRLLGALQVERLPARLAVAAVGPGTAQRLRAGGVEAALVPARAIAEGLVDVFPHAPPTGGRALVVQALDARPVVADGLRALGWDVDAVVAYRTVPAHPPAELLTRASAAEAIAFTSASTVRSWLATGAPAPPVVVCIGPVTADEARRGGLAVTAVAAEHTLDGLVAAVCHALGQGLTSP